jgi:hypothetical protein
VKPRSNRSVFRLFAAAIVLSAGALAAPIAANAQMPPPPQLKEWVEAFKDRWVTFRNWDSKQWIFLTMPLTFHCVITEIRYSLNGADLAERWPVPACDPQKPFSFERKKNQIYLVFDPGTISTVSLQLVYTDGSQSPVRTYTPCENAGETTCGVLAE